MAKHQKQNFVSKHGKVSKHAGDVKSAKYRHSSGQSQTWKQTVSDVYLVITDRFFHGVEKAWGIILDRLLWIKDKKDELLHNEGISHGRHSSSIKKSFLTSIIESFGCFTEKVREKIRDLLPQSAEKFGESPNSERYKYPEIKKKETVESDDIFEEVIEDDFEEVSDYVPRRALITDSEPEEQKRSVERSKHIEQQRIVEKTKILEKTSEIPKASKQPRQFETEVIKEQEPLKVKKKSFFKTLHSGIVEPVKNFFQGIFQGKGEKPSKKKLFSPEELPSVSQLEAELKWEKTRKSKNVMLRNSIFALVTVAAAAVLVATLFLPVLQIYGSSMTPTLSEGNIVLSFKGSDFKQGDIISFYYNNKILVKRVIAFEGDWVNIDDDGNVYVNNKLIDEPYLKKKAFGDCDIKLPYQVPSGRLFVCGDHRETSVDSRSTTLGCVSEEQIVGKIVFRVWPLSKIGSVA